jgi:hypothetical protein
VWDNTCAGSVSAACASRHTLTHTRAPCIGTELATPTEPSPRGTAAVQSTLEGSSSRSSGPATGTSSRRQAAHRRWGPENPRAAMSGTTALWDVHASQNTSPQPRQWWRRLTSVNAARQWLQTPAVASGSHGPLKDRRVAAAPGHNGTARILIQRQARARVGLGCGQQAAPADKTAAKSARGEARAGMRAEKPSQLSTRRATPLYNSL